MFSQLQPATPWPLIRKISFRFFCCLFILYTFPFPLDDNPFGREIDKISPAILGWYHTATGSIASFWHWFIPMVSKKILKVPITIFTNGSGDTTYDYTLLITQVFIAAIASTVWGILDAKRKSYNIAWYWLCVLLRYYLIGMMFGYGFAKVFHLQMPYPSLSRLVQPYGDSSPMGLVWTYVGQSKAFSEFIGLSEVLCGVLLIFRKTTLVGALLSLVVMGNIVVINFCYDVPVKLFSSMLELMALYLTSTYWKEIYRLFILHETGRLANYEQPYFKRNWVRIGVKILKWIFIADALFYNITDSFKSQKEYGDNRIKSALYGIYDTDILIRNHDTATIKNDSTRWKQLIVDYTDYAQIKLMNDSVIYYNFKIDTLRKSIIAYSSSDTLNKSSFNYTIDSSFLIMHGKMNNDSIYIRFKKFDLGKFRLMNRGFHWVNEYPYNR